MVEELERTRREMAELKALFTASNLGSSNVSDKASCQPFGEEGKHKETVDKEVLDNEDDCVAYDHPPPTEKKWASKTRKSYTPEELDEVRFDAINFIQDKM
uniref:Uncharacterized protein n=1 Tax=Daucus carota subsp. sativus TaxID=79200 RepID=A0A175YFS8_DAUCS